MAGPEEQEDSAAGVRSDSAAINSSKPAQQQAPTTIAAHQQQSTAGDVASNTSSGNADALEGGVETRSNGIASTGANNMATSSEGRGGDGGLGSEQAARTRCPCV